ncbi:MAG TPA: acyl-CoA thioesterase [Candidatus Acidoferrum sp.]|nr:acyl-CoA thioesterase [Candidatus Acidoferrum sp.]
MAKSKRKIGTKANTEADRKSANAQRGSESAGRPVSASRTQMVEVVLPQDANPIGNILGGRVMHLMDIAAAIAAHRHSHSYVVTASVDYVDFRNPIRVGELILLKSSVNRVFNTSMEVGVKIFSENTLTGEHKHTTSAYVTFVAIDANRQPQAVPPLILETEEDRRRWREAGERRAIRMAHRAKKKTSEFEAYGNR